MNRRGFLSLILAAGAAPAIVKAANIMPVLARRESGILAPVDADIFVIKSVESSSITIDQITKEAIAIFHKNAKFVSRINGHFDSFRVGDVISIAR